MAYTIGIDARRLGEPAIGGYVRSLTRGLAEIDRENEYVLLMRRGDRGELTDLPENFRFAMVTSPLYSLRELFELSWRLFRLRLDLFHATHYVLPALITCKAVISVHDIVHLFYPDYLPNDLAFFYAQRMIRSSLLRSDRIIASSRNTKTDLIDFFDADGRKIQVVYPGVASRYRIQPSAALALDWRQRQGLEGPYLLFLGSPKPRRNLDTVVQAFARACERHGLDATLVCVATRSETEFRIRQLAEQLGIASRLRLIEELPDEALSALLAEATVFLYPTLYEGLRGPVIEAMSLGVPVIASKTATLREIAEGHACLVDPLDPEALARAMAHTVQNEEQRQALAKQGLRRAEDFRWERTAQQTLEVYLSALAAGRPAAGGAKEDG